MSESRQGRLTIADHDRGSAGLTYVYPVVSRRAGGVSVGINLNVNNACNWRCIYCQVPDLIRGAPPPVDLGKLEKELSGFLQDVLHGDFLAARVPVEARRLNDIALSGNGEPTSAREFERVIDLIGEVRRQTRVPAAVKTVLITNGSLMQRAGVQAGVQEAGGTQRGGLVQRWIVPPDRACARSTISARTSSGCAQTWKLRCVCARPGSRPACSRSTACPPEEAEQRAYLDFLRERVADRLPLQGVLLYGLARQSFQPEAKPLERTPVCVAGGVCGKNPRARTRGKSYTLRFSGERGAARRGWMLRS